MRARMGYFTRKRGMRPLLDRKAIFLGCSDGGEAAMACRIREPLKRPLYKGARNMPGCTTFASPPIFAEAMNRKNTVILPEKIRILRRESVR